MLLYSKKILRADELQKDFVASAKGCLAYKYTSAGNSRGIHHWGTISFAIIGVPLAIAVRSVKRSLATSPV
jgi:hypothetical protein